MAELIEITSEKGDYFVYDPGTERIFKNNQLVPTDEACPIYAYFGKKHMPQFAGIWLRDIDIILTKSGRLQTRTGDNNLIQ